MAGDSISQFHSKKLMREFKEINDAFPIYGYLCFEVKQAIYRNGYRRIIFCYCNRQTPQSNEGPQVEW